jgi:membrane associated rhomboid family serine protease
MFRSLASDLRHQYQSGNAITRLIMVNVAVFLAIMLFKLVLTLSYGFNPDPTVFSRVTRYLLLSDDPLWNLRHPWVLVTHMFTHTGFFHLLFNMLVLYWFGRITGDLLGDHRMTGLYLYAGLFGALVYMLTAPLIYPGPSTLHGASAAAMGIVAAAGLTAPDYQMRLLLIGDVRLKYIVAALILIYLIGIANLDNAGGHMAHLGGAAFGFFYVHMLRQGVDLTRGFRRLAGLLDRRERTPRRAVKRKVPLEVRHRATKASGTASQPLFPGDGPSDEESRLNAILEKIKRSGLDSLDDEEKRFLNEASRH